jgi:hypothetical protein
MQQWEYKVFASHLDPAELVLLLDESGLQGWELVTLVAVVDDLPVAVLEPPAVAETPDKHKSAGVIATQAFRYIFKRPAPSTRGRRKAAGKVRGAVNRKR